MFAYPGLAQSGFQFEQFGSGAPLHGLFHGHQKVHIIRRCPYYRGGHIFGVSVLSEWPYYRGVRIIGVPLLSGLSDINVFDRLKG